MKKLINISPTECDCDICSKMCRAPCCGTPEDIEKLIDLGFANRLMRDDRPDAEVLIKPALKGYEGKYAPWNTSSMKGCTFWKDGKCELHDLNLKPLGGKLAHHALENSRYKEVSTYISIVWTNKKARELIKKWKKIMEERCFTEL